MAGYDEPNSLSLVEKIKESLYDVGNLVLSLHQEKRSFKNEAAILMGGGNGPFSELSIYLTKHAEQGNALTIGGDDATQDSPIKTLSYTTPFYAKAVMNVPLELVNVPQGVVEGSHKFTQETLDELHQKACNMVQCEVLAGKLYRLRHPGHPEVFPAYREANGMREYLVLSAKADGVTLSEFSHEHGKASIAQLISTGQLKGYGHVIVTSAELAESDLRRHNLVVRPDGVVIKIDNGMCLPFAQENPHYHAFTSVTVHKEDHNHADSYPVYPDLYFAKAPSGYKTAKVINWGDVIQGGFRNRNFDHTQYLSIRQNPVFQREMNATFVQMLCLPDIMLKTLCDSSVPSPDTNVSRLCYESLLEYQTRVRPHVCRDPVFLRYLASENAQDDLENYIAHIEQFSADGESRLVDSCGITDIRQTMRSELLKLRLSILVNSENSKEYMQAWYERHIQQFHQKRTKHFIYGIAAGVVLSAIALVVTAITSTLAMGLIVVVPILCIVPYVMGRMNRDYLQATKHPSNRFWEFYCRGLGLQDSDITRRMSSNPQNFVMPNSTVSDTSREADPAGQEASQSHNGYGTTSGGTDSSFNNGNAAGVAMVPHHDGHRSSSDLVTTDSARDASNSDSPRVHTHS